MPSFVVRTKLWLAAAGCLTLVPPIFAQAPPAGKSLEFDVVSVKPNKSGSGSSSVHAHNDVYQATNLSVKSLIRNAWNLNTEDLITGLPAWVSSVNFDIQAKIDEQTLSALKKLSPDDSNVQHLLMLQALLADRFQLKAHVETKELPVYALELAKGGSKLKAADPADPRGGSMNSNNQKLTSTGIPISNLCRFLAQRLHRNVEDKTGLTGTYDFTLQWSPDEAAGESPDATASGPSLFTALQEQLGLKLESTKGPVDTIVVDRIAMPSEN